MPQFVSRRMANMLLMGLFSGPLLAAVPSYSADVPSHASLAGQLLIATPAMRDPRFDQAVILVVRHDENGALGIVINRPVGEQPLARFLAALGDKDFGSHRHHPDLCRRSGAAGNRLRPA